MRSSRPSKVLAAAFAPLTVAVFAACTPPASIGPRGEPSQRSGASVSPPVVDELPELPQDPREAILAKAAVALLTNQHVLHRSIDDQLSLEALPRYVEALDGAKLFLLQSDVAALTKYDRQIDDELFAGDLVLARKGSALLVKRQRVVAKLVADLLSKPLDFTDAEEVETDPKKISFAMTEQELRSRWRRVLELQVLERLQQMEELLASKAQAQQDSPEAANDAAEKALASIPTTFSAREEKARQELAVRYQTRFVRQSQIEKLEPAARLINAVNAVFDPHTVYLAPSDKANFDIAISGTLQGIGAVLSEKDHFIVVNELIPGGASWQQGKLAAGDLILAVAQGGRSPVDVTDMSIDKVVGMIRGPKGTLVTLTVKKADGRIENISITRDIVKIEASYARGAVLQLGKTSGNVGYVYLPGFYGDLAASKTPGQRNATDDVRALLSKFKGRKIDAVVLDLRGNGGGLLTHARDISGLFIKNGPVVQTRDTEGSVEVLSDTDPSVAFSGRVVVLVDRFSASAAEILAGALQDYQRAVIVGTSPTHGKGTVQAVVDLDQLKAPGGSLGVYNVTVEEYFRVNGASTQLKGVTPDVLMPDPTSFVDSREETLFHPIPWSSVDPARYTPVPRPWSASQLQAASAARVRANPAFAKVTAFSQLFEARQKNTSESLELTTYQARRAREKAEFEAADPKLKDMAAFFSVTELSPTNAPPATDEKLRQRLDVWKKDLARDPWIAESLHVLDDMAKTPSPKRPN